jgi:hypothetical protein
MTRRRPAERDEYDARFANKAKHFQKMLIVWKDDRNLEYRQHIADTRRAAQPGAVFRL